MANPLRFTPVEPMPVKSLSVLPVDLHIGRTPINFEVALIRLLTGTLDIACNLDNINIIQRINYSQLPASKNLKISSKTIKRSINPYTLKDLINALSKKRGRNYTFYRDLFFEFSNYFLRKKQNNEIVAFLHLYRILESISYTFPLIWASKANDYIGTFSQLRGYFNGEKTGELRMFERFIEDVIPSPLLNFQVQFQINSVHSDWQERYYHAIFNNIIPNDIVSYNEFSDITVKTHTLTSLMINLRNKYFHSLSGNGNNFGSEDIVEANELFLSVNEIFANWLSIIYFEILDYEIG